MRCWNSVPYAILIIANFYVDTVTGEARPDKQFGDPCGLVCRTCKATHAIQEELLRKVVTC